MNKFKYLRMWRPLLLVSSVSCEFVCLVNLLKPYYTCAAPVTSDSSSQSLNVSLVLTVDSESSGTVAPGVGLDEDVYIRVPNDPVVCSRAGYRD